MSFGDWNLVRGCPGWYYGLLLRSGDGSVTFSVGRSDGLGSISGLRASGYRTTTVARRMGVKDLRGYQDVARRAIKAHEAEIAEQAYDLVEIGEIEVPS